MFLAVAAPLIGHQLRSLPAAVESTVEVDAYNSTPRFHRIFVRGSTFVWAARIDPGVVDHSIQPPELLDGLVNQRADLLDLADVAWDEFAADFLSGLAVRLLPENRRLRPLRRSHRTEQQWPCRCHRLSR